MSVAQEAGRAAGRTLRSLSHDQRVTDAADEPAPPAMDAPFAAASAALAVALAAARLSRHIEAVCVAWAWVSQSLHSLDGMSHTKQKQLAQNIALALKAPLTHRFSTQFSRACGNCGRARRV